MHGVLEAFVFEWVSLWEALKNVFEEYFQNGGEGAQYS